ncbi:DUF3024 domain-containing protein [Mangrovibacterium lignilyticum]|uniref:DUF3024 domain-containing protein n=1 Tax=Mangrovibacterium lignilyticum TaxID=2668052 RepID=UPI0013D772C3|nr:DUF3024 domain-containing protein [Mangrovibacterium lignilyticum]
MALDIVKTANTILALENFLAKRRPPEHLRDQIDLNYKIEDQSIILFEERPHWQKPGVTIESKIAKAAWVKARQCWKIYWLRADLKWHSYQPAAEVQTIEEFLKVVDEDSHGCFWG